MEVSTEIQNLLRFIDNGMIWICILVFFAVTYLLVSLLTWSFLKPLKYLGIPTVLVGLLLVVIRFSSSAIASVIEKELGFIKNVIPIVLKPLLINGIGCIVIGILMIVGYVIINKRLENREIIKE